MKSLKENIDFELSHWNGRRQDHGVSCGPRYILDTVLHHEENTNGLFKANEFMELMRGPAILEIGCNAGGFTTLFAKKGMTVGLDLLHLPLAYAYRWAEAINRRDFSEETWGDSWCHPPNWTVECLWTQGEASNLPFRDDSFDTVCMPDTIEHFPPHLRARAIDEATRVVKLGGRFLISAILDVYNPMRPTWKEDMLRDVHPFGLPTAEELWRWITQAGVDIFFKYDDWLGKGDTYRQIFFGCDKNI